MNAVYKGYTALILAAREGMSRYAGLLIKAGADVNKVDCRRRGALYYSAEKFDYEFMELLLKAGADVNPRYSDGNFPLAALNSFRLPYNRHTDAKRRCRRLKSLNMLIKVGADVNVRDRRHLTALMSAAGNGYVECIRVMVKVGPDVNAETPNGKTALVYATLQGSVNCIKTLLKAGADVNAGQNQDGGTALIIASRYGSYESVDVLLKAGADVNAGDKDGYNALHLLAAPAFICSKHYLKCGKKLLRAGIHINRFPKSEGKNALGKALKAKYRVKKGDEKSYRDLLMLLYAAGETLEGTDVDKIPEELKFEEEKLELKHICREAIRKHLLKLDPHQHLFSRIPKLGLPSALSNYLLFNILLDEEDDGDDYKDNTNDDDGDNDDEDNDDDDAWWC